MNDVHPLESTPPPSKVEHPERKRSYSNHPFSGAKMLVSGRVYISKVESPWVGCDDPTLQMSWVKTGRTWHTNCWDRWKTQVSIVIYEQVWYLAGEAWHHRWWVWFNHLKIIFMWRWSSDPSCHSNSLRFHNSKFHLNCNSFFATHWKKWCLEDTCLSLFCRDHQDYTAVRKLTAGTWNPRKKKKNEVFFEDHIPFQLSR